jgi:tRNA modification GTPase
VCICGRPNVGKSSLLNALIGEDRVIVTPIAGTTRDVIEEAVNLNGVPALLWDTAGIRDTDDQIERLGVSLTRHHIERADAVIVVLDGSMSLTPDDEQLLGDTRRKGLVALNKSDLPQVLTERELAGFVCSSKICRVSAKTGDGIPELKQKLRDLVVESEFETPVVITNSRHRAALQRSREALNRAAQSLSDGYAAEFVALDLNGAREALEEITGLINNEDILDRIFSDFCIGK